MVRTRIYPVTGFHVDVQESYELVEKLIADSDCGCFITFTLESGDPVSFQRDYIVYFTKF